MPDPYYDGPGAYDEDDAYDFDSEATVVPLASTYRALLELAFGADPTGDPESWVWTHVPELRFWDQAVTITRGRADEAGDPAPSAVSFTIDNRSGDYTPTDPRSPYYPNIRRGTPVRFWVNKDGEWRIRFVGQVSEWQPTWPLGDISDHADPVAHPGEADMTIVCNGILRRLGQGAKPLSSALRRFIPGMVMLVDYWPMEDGTLTTLPSSANGGSDLGVAGVFQWGGDETLIGSSALPTLGVGASWFGRARISDFQRWLAVQYVHLPQLPSATTVLVVTRTGHRLRVQLSSTQLTIDEKLGDDGAWDTIATEALAGDPTTGWLRVTLDTLSHPAVPTAKVVRAGSSAVLAEVDGIISGGAVGFNLVGVGGRVAAPPQGMAVGHLAVFYDPLAVPFDLSPLDAPDAGWVGETAADRVTRLCAEEGIALNVTAGDLSTPMGVQKPLTLLALLSECAVAEQGVLGEQVDRPGLTFRTRATRYNQDPALILDASANEIAEPFAPAYDDQRLRNDVTVTRQDGTSARELDEDSIETEGTYDEQVTVSLAEDMQARHHAAWRLHLGTWDAMRYPSLSGDLDTAPDGWLDLALGDRVQVTDLPPQHPEAAVDVVVEGFSETISPESWIIEANCSPAGPWDVWLVGDAVGSAPLAL